MSVTPQPAPEILSLVHACGPHINSNHALELARAFGPPQQQTHETEPTVEQLESVYDTARKLCDDGNFQFAAALALHLFTYKPGDPRFGFIAGTCMQRLGSHATAVKFYCYALVAGGDHPAALLRLGECLLALGDTPNAEKAFDAAMDVARDFPDMGEFQDVTRQLMDSLKTGGRSAPDHR